MPLKNLRPSGPSTLKPHKGLFIWPQPPKGECISDARRAVVWFSHGRMPGCEGSIQTGAFYQLEAPSRTLSGIATVKLKNPRGDSPVKLWNPQAPKGLVHKAVVWFSPPKAAFILALKAPYLASGAVLYTSRGREPSTRPEGVSRSRTEPLAPRAKGPAAPSTLAAKPRQPSGIPASTAQVLVPTAPKALVPIITF